MSVLNSPKEETLNRLAKNLADVTFQHNNRILEYPGYNKAIQGIYYDAKMNNLGNNEVLSVALKNQDAWNAEFKDKYQAVLEGIKS